MVSHVGWIWGTGLWASSWASSTEQTTNSCSWGSHTLAGGSTHAHSRDQTRPYEASQLYQFSAGGEHGVMDVWEQEGGGERVLWTGTYSILLLFGRHFDTAALQPAPGSFFPPPATPTGRPVLREEVSASESALSFTQLCARSSKYSFFPLDFCFLLALTNHCLSLSLLFIRWVVSESLGPYGLQHARLPWPSPSLGVFSDSCPLSWWCHPTISSSVALFSSCPQSFPASGSFSVSHLFASGGQSIVASASVLPVNIQSWFPLGLTGLISWQSRVFSNTTGLKASSFSTEPSLWSSSHICTWLLEKKMSSLHFSSAS